jgi:putative ABC transport system permease protein
MAVRQSFGASRARIVRIVVAEGFALSLAAWTVAMLFAYWMSQILPGLIPESENGHAPLRLDFTPDERVLAYAMGLAVAATVAFTVAPALRTWQQDLLSFLKAGEQAVVQGRSRVSQALVVVQMAFSVLLLTSAGLAYRSLSIIDGTNLGFDPRSLLLATIDTTGTVETAEAHRALLDQIRDGLQRLPGVDVVSYTRHAPSHSWPDIDVRVERGKPPVVAERNAVGADYLKLMGVPLLAGREFSPGRSTQGAVEAVVNQQLADSLSPGASPIGLTIFVGPTEQPAVVVGVTPNVLFSGFRRQARPSFVLLSPQADELGIGITTLYVRHRSRLETVVPAVTRAVRQDAPSVPVLYMRTMDTQLDEMTWPVRILTRLLTIFAAGSLLIAALGQYAAMAFSMRRRVRDFGIRIALGASTRQVLSSALGEGIRLTAFGLAIGLGLGVVAGRSAQSLLYGVTPTDAPTYAAVLVLLGSASLLACYLPARFAARIDPIRALRQE